LLENNNFSRNPLPDEDPYRLVNSSFVQDLNNYFASASGFTTPNASTAPAVPAFAPLSDELWDQLQTIGSLKTRNIVFVSGTSDISYEGKSQIDQQMIDLVHYPNFRIEVRGHTGLRGDSEQNMMLSQDRADAVLRYLEITHGVVKNRARAKGFGSTQPLPKLPGESMRSYNYRLPRVEIRLVRETI
jgi:outer membrane protein OmpA-like peptidoglycan-associated protein